ncbi:hypothetical protein E2C01_094674 [Portunus trituberculatus]|uniref:Uncharacterized protein n=1 Tax=Portunus trituberculatus TaxID=210409 RepID=A0A5B7JR34_PORTR|nr:hypothetical protein [Portunus trituberculatus]
MGGREMCGAGSVGRDRWPCEVSQVAAWRRPGGVCDRCAGSLAASTHQQRLCLRPRRLIIKETVCRRCSCGFEHAAAPTPQLAGAWSTEHLTPGRS